MTCLNIYETERQKMVFLSRPRTNFGASQVSVDNYQMASVIHRCCFSMNLRLAPSPQRPLISRRMVARAV